MKRFSILQKTMDRCYVCGTSHDLHVHEVFYGINRQTSIKQGCCVALCGRHHNMSDHGVHFNRELDLRLKRDCERRWMEQNGSEEEFIRIFGRSYL